MDRKHFLPAIMLLSILALACSEKTRPPNVILVLVDDMGYGDIAAHGNPVLKTPHFDQLYRESARFENFAVSPTCSPTRAALLTGRHEFLVGVTHTLLPMRQLDTTAATIAQLFQNEGYKTGLFGKWHLGQAGPYGPWYRGFDETLTVPGDVQNSHFDPLLLKNKVEQQFEGYREDILFREAMNFIKVNKDGAFFCYLPTYSPHGPNKVPERYSKPYEGYINPERPDGEYSTGFFGQIANIDENLGRLRDFLDAEGLVDNTLLIVMNDNGGTRGVDTHNSGMRGAKTTPWRGGTRAYSFWMWGDRFPKGERNLMSGHVDVFPTLADLCLLDLPAEVRAELDGSSLKAVLETPASEQEEDRMQVHHIGRWSIPENWTDHKYAGCAVRWGKYTLVRHEPCQDQHCGTCRSAYRRGIEKKRPLYTSNTDHYALTYSGDWELFDIESDPYQDYNISGENPQVVQKMSEYYEKWWDKVGARMTR